MFWKLSMLSAESIPECDTNLTDSSTSVLEENDSLWMWCSVEFRGNLNPVMEWMNGSNGEITHSKATLISNKLLVSEIVVQVKNSEKDVFLSCTTRFDLTSVRNIMKNFSDRVNTMATNIPDYRLPWISPPITISRMRNMFTYFHIIYNRVLYFFNLLFNCHHVKLYSLQLSYSMQWLCYSGTSQVKFQVKRNLCSGRCPEIRLPMFHHKLVVRFY